MFTPNCHSTAPTPETIARLGKEAADLALQGRIHLNDAVAKVASKTPNLNNRHMTTICWEANNEYFRKVAYAREKAGQDLLFEFDMAEPNEVLMNLEHAVTPKLSFAQDPDYIAPPPRYNAPLIKIADVRPPPPPVDVKKEVAALVEETKQVHDHFRQKLAGAEVAHRRATSALHEAFRKEAALQTPQAAILDLWETHDEGEKLASATYALCYEHLSKTQPTLRRQLEKEAHVTPSGIPNLRHPIYQAYDAYAKAKIAHAQAAAGEQIAHGEHEEAQRVYRHVLKHGSLEGILVGGGLGAAGGVLSGADTERAQTLGLIGATLGSGYSPHKGYSLGRAARNTAIGGLMYGGYKYLKNRPDTMTIDEANARNAQAYQSIHSPAELNPSQWTGA